QGILIALHSRLDAGAIGQHGELQIFRAFDPGDQEAAPPSGVVLIHRLLRASAAERRKEALDHDSLGFRQAAFLPLGVKVRGADRLHGCVLIQLDELERIDTNLVPEPLDSKNAIGFENAIDDGRYGVRYSEGIAAAGADQEYTHRSRP